MNWAVFRKEFFGYFTTPLAYVAWSGFVLVSSLFLWFFSNEYNVFKSGVADLSTFFFIAPWIFLFLLPALTMRLLSEEALKGTLQWLFTQPISLRNILISKFLVVIIFISVALLATTTFVWTLSDLKNPSENIDTGSIWAGYLGLFLLATSFASIGLFCSAFAQNQVVAYVSGVLLSFFFFYGFQGLASYNLLGNFDYFVQKLGFYYHYNQFLKGLIDTRSLLFFLMITTVFWVLTWWYVNRKKQLG